MHCKNCNAELREEEKYCYNCGQKNSQGRLTTKAFINESWQEFLRFDRRFFRTMFTLLIPGRLTNEIISGRRARYIKPIRLYIGLSILMIASLNISIENPLDIGDSEFDQVNLSLSSSTIKSKSYDQLIQDKYAKEILLEHNQHLLDSNIVDSDRVSDLDQITQSFIKEKKLVSIDSIDIIQFNFQNNGILQRPFAIDDITNLNKKELYAKYKISYWLNKKLLTQYVRFVKRGSNFFLFLMQKVGICILLMIPFLALFLKLFYVRSTFYYSEHLSFSLHTHSFLYLLISLLTGVSLMIDNIAQNLPGIAVSVFGLYLFLSLKFVYKQNLIKTIIKFIIINAAYILLSGVFIVILAFLSFLLF